MEELKACPFCGGTGYGIIEATECAGHGNFGESSYYQCWGCGAVITFHGYFNRFNPEKWNTRAEDPVKAELAGVIERISEDGHAMMSMTVGSSKMLLAALAKAKAKGE